MPKTEIMETDYKPDFEISDKYINFSSELLRLSLLAISGIGALILLSIKGDSDFYLFKFDKLILFVALMFFAISSGMSMFHRFYATDALSYHIAYLRKKTPEEKVGRTRCLKLSKIFLIVTEVAFGVAVFVFVLAVFQLLICH